MSQPLTFSVKSLVEKILESLDQKPVDWSYVAVPQLLLNNVKILVNANPLGKPQFTEFWMKLPLSQHRLQNFDFHAVPGLNIANVVVSGKVRFDESGKNKMDESADMIPLQGPSRAIWGSFMGFTIALVVDVTTLGKGECVLGFDYRVNHVPTDSVMNV